jgi:hypothetical protein
MGWADYTQAMNNILGNHATYILIHGYDPA